MLTRRTEDDEADIRARQIVPAGAARSRVATGLRVIAQFVLMALVLAGAYLGMMRLIATRPEIPARPPFPKVYTVDTVTARAGDFQPVYAIYGEIVARRSVDLRALVAGRVVSVSPQLKAGARVSKGDALVEIDRFDYEGALREARANLRESGARLTELRAGIRMEENRLERAREQLGFARKDLERIRSLIDSGSATDKQLDDRNLLVSQREASVEETEVGIEARRAQVEQQEAALERLEWKVELAQRNLANTVLDAPFDGIVRSAQVEAGKMVSANDVAVTLYEEGNLEVRFTLSNERFARIAAGDGGLIGRQVEIVPSTDAGRTPLSAQIDRLGADIENTRGGVEVYARLVAPDAAMALRPGAFVEVRVPDRMFDGHYRLPETAIHDSETVYVVIDGRLAARSVLLSAWDGEHALVTGDITDGDEILVTRIAEIGEGLRVAPHVGGPADGQAEGAPRAPAAD
ncbi:MAG: efflux RND transporter periplasmic adaptor subunit [Pseudomonadota bacterium]|nr:efflux RND transporter periplasmic adaptor subunit [Pseudomonadota bacterium]